MMSITISLTPDQEQKLEELARRSGKDPSEYVHDVVTAYLNGRGRGVKTFEEILAPIWEGWRQSGLLDAEIDDLFQTASFGGFGENGISGKGGCESARRAGSRSRLHGVLAGGIAAGRSSGTAFHRVPRGRHSDPLRERRHPRRSS